MQSDLTLGLFRTDFIYQDIKSLRTSSSLKNFMQNYPDWTWNHHFIELYLKGEDTWPQSPVNGFKKVCRFTSLTVAQSFDFVESLHRHFTAENSSINIALSGGLDSQVLALYAKQRGINVKAYYLRSDIKGYCEAESVKRFCQQWSIECHEIKTNFDDFIQAMPLFLKATECPIYNLHPVSKWILAREISALGIKKLYSGDGADQVFAGASFCDLFFLTKKCFREFKVDLITPFACWPLLHWAQEAGPYVNKEPLRKWAYKKWGLSQNEKKSSFFPDKDYGINSLEKSLELLRSSLCAE